MMVIRSYRGSLCFFCIVAAVASGFNISACNPRETAINKSPKSAGESRVLQPTDSTDLESSKLFRVKQNGKTGYIDKAGSVIISPEFDAAEDFSEGLAAVAMKSGDQLIDGTDGPTTILKWGFINETGQPVIPLEFSRVGRFSEGLAWAEVGDKRGRARYGIDKHGYVDKAGKMVIAPQLSFIFDPHGIDDGRADFKEGLAVVRIGTKQGYIDKTGRTAIRPEFENASSFSEGVAAVQLGDKYGYIDRAGKVVISPRFGWAGRFSEGLAAIAIEDGYGYADKNGKVIIRSRFTLTSSFSEGLAMVHLDGRVSYIDKTGNVVITTQGKTGGDFREGLAVGSFDGGYGYVDKTGGFAIKPQYNRVESFSGGLAKVYIGLNQWGYINKKGEYVWKPAD